MSKDPNRGSTTQRLTRAVEGREQAVTRRVDLVPSVPLELRPRADEVLGEKRTPPGVPELGSDCGRADDVREEKRREDPAPAPEHEAVEEWAIPCKHDLDAGLVADHVAVVPGRNLEHIVRPVDDFGAVGKENPHSSRQDDSRVANLTPLSADGRTEVFGPAPPRLRDHLAERHLAELYE